MAKKIWCTMENAKKIAIMTLPEDTWSEIRDIADRFTYGCCDCEQLDMLTDWAEIQANIIRRLSRGEGVTELGSKSEPRLDNSDNNNYTRSKE